MCFTLFTLLQFLEQLWLDVMSGFTLESCLLFLSLTKFFLLFLSADHRNNIFLLLLKLKFLELLLFLLLFLILFLFQSLVSLIFLLLLFVLLGLPIISTLLKSLVIILESEDFLILFDCPCVVLNISLPPTIALWNYRLGFAIVPASDFAFERLFSCLFNINGVLVRLTSLLNLWSCLHPGWLKPI